MNGWKAWGNRTACYPGNTDIKDCFIPCRRMYNWWANQFILSYFSKVDDRTIIVFFGDHQPSDTVAAPILAMNGMQWNALDEEQQKLRYQVPYVIWANYDIDEEQNADTSANYLGAEVLKRAGVPTDAYQNFLLTLKESYPVISAVRTVEADGSETPAKEEHGEMDIYRKLQYYFMFDWEEESGE